tara:strand:+ start:2935 stop:3327 length:393 start_codon:yes stop_codon:yes gene_type:complete
MAYNDHRASDYNMGYLCTDGVRYMEETTKPLTSLTDTDHEFQFVIQVENAYGEIGTTRYYDVKLQWAEEHEEFYHWELSKEYIMDLNGLEYYGLFHDVKKSDVRIFERVGNRLVERLADRTGPHLCYGKN